MKHTRRGAIRARRERRRIISEEGAAPGGTALHANQRNHLDVNGGILIGIGRMRDHLHRELAKVFRAFNLTTTQYSVLDILHRRGDLSVGEIQTGILCTQGNLPVVIGNLLKQGYIERTHCGGDRRVTIVRITDSGKEIVTTVFPHRIRRLGELLDGYTQKEKKQLSHLLSSYENFNGIGNA